MAHTGCRETPQGLPTTRRRAGRRPAAVLALATVSVVALAAAALGAGCSAPAAVERSQQLQLAAMIQYRDQMATYHEKAKAQLAAEKRAQLDAALAASLAQDADAEGRVPLSAATEKLAKRLALEDEFRANLARLDSEFNERQAAISRAIELAEDTLGLLAEYNRLASLLRSLFVKELEAQDLVSAYETGKEPEP